MARKFNASVEFDNPITLLNGSVGAPAVSFTAETNSGLYRAASKDIGLAVNGADLIRAGSANNAGASTNPNPSIGLLGAPQSSLVSINATYTVPDTASASQYVGLQHVMTWNPGSLAAMSASAAGALFRITVSDALAAGPPALLGDLTGTYIAFRGSGLMANTTKTLTAVIGVSGEVGSLGSSDTGAVTAATAVYARSPGTIFNAVTSYYGLRADDCPAISAGGSIGTSYGLHLASQTRATVSWAIYSLGGNSSHLGSFRFGDNNTPTATVDINGTLSVSGVATGPTAAVDTSTSQLATTAFVLGQAASANPVMNGVVAVGVSTRYARADHVHASDSSRATLVANSFSGVQTLAYTGTGNPLSVQVTHASYTGSALYGSVLDSVAGASAAYNLLQLQSGVSGVTDRMFVGGTGVIHSTSTSITAISARALKEDIIALPGALDAILALRPRRYAWAEHPLNEGRVGDVHYGFVAEEVEQVLPSIVDDTLWQVGEGREKIKSLRTGDLIPFLVGAVQEIAGALRNLGALA